MNQTKIKVLEKPKTVIIKYVTIDSVDLSENYTFFVTVFDKNHNIVDRNYIAISENEYNHTEFDKTKIINLILNKIGLEAE